MIEEIGRETATRGFEKGPKAMRIRQDGERDKVQGLRDRDLGVRDSVDRGQRQ